MEPFIGQIKLFPYNFAPYGWVACAGQVLPIAANQALYALIGNKFGGDGRTTFGLPDLRGFEPQLGTQYCIAGIGIFPPRS